ncbi:MAG TPA: recombinase family protein [Chitinophagaceae bacterium]
MKRCISYSRVSTDEQAEKGYSLPEQAMRIKNFCERSDIEIIESYSEDHSAKTFNRPEFQKILRKIESKEIRIDFIVVTKLDRFSRDVFGAFEMYNILSRHGIFVWSIPEGVFDLSNVHTFFPNIVQMTAAHYDNLLRSENTKRGLRQAQRLGYWISTAPKGYSFDKSEGRGLLVRNEDAILIEESFRLFSTGIYSIEEVRREMNKKGLKCSKNGFNYILRNNVYAGQIKIPKWKDEPEEIITGRHDPIIDKVTFEAVQDIINGRYKKIVKKIKGEKYYLLGYLFCPVCLTKPMRASSPKGRSRNYEYYHCDTKNKCGCKNFPVELVHHSFIEELKSFQIKSEMLELYYEVLADVFKIDEKAKDQEVTLIRRELKQCQEMSDQADDKYISGKLADCAYNRAKERYGESIYSLNERLNLLLSHDSKIESYLQFGLCLLADLSGYFERAGFYTKRRIIGSIFPEKLVFDGQKNRTGKINQFVELTTLKINDLIENKIGQNNFEIALPNQAPPVGLEPTTL